MQSVLVLTLTARQRQKEPTKFVGSRCVFVFVLGGFGVKYLHIPFYPDHKIL